MENIPDGWVLCNGQDETPDLRDKFIMGAGATPPNKSGGPDQHRHKVDPPRASFRTGEAGNHTHATYSDWYRRGLAGGPHNGIDINASQQMRTDNAGNHRHSGTVDIEAFESSSSGGKNRPAWYALCYIMRRREG